MASNNFDEVSRTLAVSTSRRHAMKVLFAGAVGGALSLVGIGSTQARANCAAAGVRCGQNNECCSYSCDRTTGVCSCRARDVRCSQNYECCSSKCSFGLCV
jgi:hypothetical protein